jgi:hypothetical protein
MNGDKSVGESTWNSAMGSTLLGQHYSDGSASVISVATKETTTTREALDPDPLQQVEEVKVVNVQQRQQQNDDTHIGSMDTDSYEDEPVPTDEELFVAGWAKALDNSSGSYYYFTLDRTKTVWDNPLAPFSESRSDDSGSDTEDDDTIVNAIRDVYEELATASQQQAEYKQQRFGRWDQDYYDDDQDEYWIR